MKPTTKPATKGLGRDVPHRKLSDELILNIGAIVFAIIVMVAAITDIITSHQRAMIRLRMEEVCKCQ